MIKLENNAVSLGQTERIIELDAIRGIAALAVLFCHLPYGFWFGETGVDAFFVLSGYLITTIILRNLDHPRFFSNFYIRRSLRIFPIYYIAILCVYSLNLLREHPGATSGLPFYLGYLQNIHNYWGGETPQVNLSLGHTWTLAIEEQFYLIWPATLFFMRKKLSIWLPILLFILPLFLRAFGLPRVVLLGHLDALALGALLALLFLNPDFSKQKASKVFILIFLSAFCIYWGLWLAFVVKGGHTGKEFIQNNYAISLLSLTYFGFIGFVICKTGDKSLFILRNKWLLLLGSVSYGLYLWHWIIYELLDTFIIFRWKMGQTIWLDLVKIVVSIATALISWHLIEKPILKLKERFNY